jgi:Mg2+ and Co2+ transporter CorA
MESIRRRPTRSNTVRHYSTSTTPEPYSEEPGAEPGIDTQREDAPSKFAHMKAECQITLVDFSQDRIEQHELDNRAFLEFIARPRPSWVECRWMNINAISFDVIRALQKEHNLHSLAIEDLVQSRSRTKADWYSDHAFMLLTLQKLVRLTPAQIAAETKRPSFSQRAATGSGTDASSLEKQASSNGSLDHKISGFVANHDLQHIEQAGTNFKTLQRYRDSGTIERAMYMERHSALTKRGFAVSVEQVSIFLTKDNTVISFFENSADDIEGPILRRLNSQETILRQSCDASMMVQAVIDAVIDLAIPVISVYEDVMADLELDVLTDPDLQHSKMLYILSSELSLLKNSIQPIASLISALRDHKSEASVPASTTTSEPPSSTLSSTTDPTPSTHHARRRPLP